MPANAPPTALELQQAGTDIDTLGKVINEPANFGGTGTVTTRRGGPVKTLAWYLAELDTHRLAAAAVVANLQDKTAAIAALAAALAPGQPLDRIVSNLNNVIAASGVYPVPLGAHDSLAGTVISDPRVTVTYEDERYRPRVLPHTVTLPFDPDDWYLLAAQSADADFILAELRRLATYHPPIEPEFGVNRTYAFAAGSSGVIIDLNSLVTDPDSPPENRIFQALDALPSGVTLSGSVLSRSAPPIQAPMVVTFQVTDENGLTDTVDLTLHSFDTAAPPTTPPAWTTPLPVLNLTRGLAMPPLNARSFLTAGTTPLHAITITAAGVPGLQAVDGVLSGTPTQNGGFSITWTATDAFGAAVQYIQQVDIAPGSAPAWTSIGEIVMTLGQTLPPVRYESYLNSAPYAITAVAISVAGQPGGTALSGRELRGVPTAAGVYSVTVTATNPAGQSTPLTHVIYVNPPVGGGGGGGGGDTGGGGGGGGGREDPGVPNYY